MVLSVTVIVPMLNRPPPPLIAFVGVVFALMVTRVRVAVPVASLNSPPPPQKPLIAVFPLMMVSLTLTVPLLLRPPPPEEPVVPPDILRPEMAADALAPTINTRLALLAWTVS